VASVPLFIMLSVILWWGMLRMVAIWIGYLQIRKPVFCPAPKGKTVAIYTTSSPGEPLSMFDKTLAACAQTQISSALPTCWTIHRTHVSKK
jgi:cellulose synthase (UDP-forming)